MILTQFTVRPTFLEEIVEAQARDPKTTRMMDRIRKGEMSGFTVEDGVLKCGSRIYVPDIKDLRKVLLEEAHLSAYSVHPGCTKMYRDLRSHYWWRTMR